MSIMLLTSRGSWQQICDVTLQIAQECREAPHYLWVEKPQQSRLATELETLLAHLGLEEQWAYIAAGTQRPLGVTRVVDACDSER